MKTLALLRHAKSSWKNAALSDFERPLNDRGKKDAPEMARRLHQYGYCPELMVVSPARRARKTAAVFADTLGCGREGMVFREEIYHTDLEGLVVLLQNLDDDLNRVLLVGHNPFLTMLAEWFSGERFGNIPTCGLVLLEFPVDSWRQLVRDGGRVLHYDYPKKTPATE